jgi:hypothetical protein
MADFGIKPDIALGVKGPQQQSLSDLLGTATKAMEFSRLSELYPELIRKTKAEAAGAETTAAKGSLDYNLGLANTIAAGQTSMITNPLIVKAANAPDSLTSDERKALVTLVTDNSIQQSKNAGIPWEGQGQKLAQPYITMAMNNPGGLKQYYTERMLAGLDSATRLSRGTGEIQSVAGQPSLVNPLMPRPVQPIPGFAPGVPVAEGGRTDMGANMPVAPQGVQPAAPAQPAAPKGVTSADMTQRPGGPGFDLPYPKPQPGVAMAVTTQYQADEAAGNKYRNGLATARQTIPAGTRNVDEVLRGAAELAKTVNFETGKPADIERAVRVFFGDARYKELSKNIANAQIAIAQAQGASTDSMRELISKATGDETYPPPVLLSIASRLRGELKGLDLEAQGAQAFATKFGDANLPAYRDVWARNASDNRVFEAMSIMDSRMSRDQREKALDKILPIDAAELQDFRTRIQNIRSLSQFGTLPSQSKPSKR